MRCAFVIFSFILFYFVVDFVNSQDVNATESQTSLSPPPSPDTTLSTTSTNGISHQYEDLSSPREFDRFWKSIGRIVHKADDQFILIANQIAQVSAQLNQSSSLCYRVIEQAFRTGLQKQWSAKCKCYKSTDLLLFITQIIFFLLFYCSDKLKHFQFGWFCE